MQFLRTATASIRSARCCSRSAPAAALLQMAPIITNRR
uniref:Uncharacterized protein n=1 Tax=Macrostomum lignano TaxID=282301 RepID=A0A1I8GQ40_9PLAT